MSLSQNSIPIARLISVFFVLLVAGILLALPLYHFDWRRFIRSKLFIKIIFWIPIFLLFVGMLYASDLVRLTVLLVLLSLAFSELLQVLHRQHHIVRTNYVILIVYFVIFGAALLHFYFIKTSYPTHFIKYLIIICFTSVIADVTAFFMGNYLGKHKLPAILNENKSWEGVAGQILGALIGVLIVNAFIVPIPHIMIFLPIGVGSAAGDLANSYVKRRVDIKDWSNNIPGHGGFLDRLSSLAGSAVFTFYFLKLTGNF